MNALPYYLQVALGIGFLIFIHELGHYLCARFVGVKVEVFSLGFGPRLLGFRRNGCDYRLSLVPLGGYVRVLGEDPTMPEVGAGSLSAKSVPARALFYSGGVVMNLLFAIVAFPLVFHHGVEFNAPVVGEVAYGSPAWEADLRPGDRVLSVEGKEMYSFHNLRVEIALQGDRETRLEVRRSEQVLPKVVQPRYNPLLGWYDIGVAALPAAGPPRLEVRSGGPAERAGLRDGDRLVAIDGRPVDGRNVRKLLEPLSRPNAEARLEVLRDGRRLTFEVQSELLDVLRIGVARARRRVAGIRPGLDAIRRLGLRREDHVVELNGRPFPGGTLDAVRDGPPDVSIRVLRGGAAQPLLLRGTLTEEERHALPEHVALLEDRIGVVVRPQPGLPAERAGMLPGDEIVAIDGRPVQGWKQFSEAVREAAGRELVLGVRRGDGVVEIRVRPERCDADPGFGVIVEPVRELYRKETFAGALQAGLVCSIDLVKQLYVMLKRMFTGEVAAKNLGGIITIARVSYDFAQSGWARFLYFLALLSINLAFINVLPIPVLDGGHLLFVAIEAIKGSPVSPRVLGYGQILGLVFVLALLVFVTYNDILRLL